MFFTEVKSLVRLATPVSLALLCLVGMSATDVLIAGHAGTEQLAGMNLGSNTWNMLVMFFMGIGFATQPLVAKYFGANDERGLKNQLHQSIWMCLALGIIAMACVWLVAWSFKFINFETTLKTIAVNYLLVISFCAIPMVTIPAFRGTLEGMSLTREVFIINFTMFLLNIPLDYIFVEGLFGMPKLGGVGCALATVFLMWFALFGFVLVIRGHAKTRDKLLLKNFSRPDVNVITKTFRLGLPIGFSIIIELSMFAGAGMLIAFFGVVQVGAHAVAIIVASLSFMLYMGLAQGVTIRASQFLGAGEPDAAWYTIKVGTSFNMMIACVLCLVFVFFNEPLVSLFSDDPEVIVLAVSLMYFGAAFQLVDCLQIAMVCALRAYHDTSSPPKYQFVAFLLFGMPLGVGLSFYNYVPGLSGAKGMWTAMLLSLMLVSLFLSWRLWRHQKTFDIESFALSG